MLYSNDPKFLRMSQFTLLKEGPMSNAKFDPGGLTKFGIAQNMHPELDVKNLTQEQALQVYYDQYYLASGANLAYYGFGLAIFECAVNQGVNKAIRLVQGTIGPYIDGELGPRTQAAIKAVTSTSEVLPLFMSARVSAYVAIKDSNPDNYATNHHGWFKRLMQCVIEGAK